MRTMARAVGLLLVVAFVAGLWDARYGQEERRPAPFRSAAVERERSPRTAPGWHTRRCNGSAS